MTRVEEFALYFIVIMLTHWCPSLKPKPNLRGWAVCEWEPLLWDEELWCAPFTLREQRFRFGHTPPPSLYLCSVLFLAPLSSFFLPPPLCFSSLLPSCYLRGQKKGAPVSSSASSSLRRLLLLLLLLAWSYRSGITRQNSHFHHPRYLSFFFPSVYLNKMYLDVCGHAALWAHSPGRKLPLTAACATAFCQLPLLSKLHPHVRRARPVKCCRAFCVFTLGIWVFRNRILRRQLRCSICF